MSKQKADKLALAALMALLWPLDFTTHGSLALAGDRLADAQRIEAAAEGSPAASPNPPSEKPCVLLRNDNVLYGTARQLGELVVIQTGEGGEIKLPRGEVLCWASSIRNLFQYRVDHRQTGDLRAMARDARWCIRFDLYDLAAQEIGKIRQIDPSNVHAQQIEDQLRRQTAAKPAPSALPTKTGAAHQAPIKIVGFEDPADEPTQLDPNTLRRFASHIQPMLTNRCGRCHDRDTHSTEGWSITMPMAGSRASSRITRDNLIATLSWVDANVPDQSPLLEKAITAHGATTPPLDARNAKAIQSLRMWLWMAADSMAHPPAEQPRIASRNNSDRERPSTVSVGNEAVDQTGDQRQSQQTSSPAALDVPARLPQVANPFDPELFNRKFHLDSSQAK